MFKYLVKKLDSPISIRSFIKILPHTRTKRRKCLTHDDNCPLERNCSFLSDYKCLFLRV